MRTYSEGSPRRGRVLVADDNRLIQLSLGEILSRLNFDSKVVSDGRSALGELETGGYDMVFLDLNMPAVNGIDCVREIRRRESEASTPRLPVAIITGALEAEVRDECLLAGADDVLAKPFTVEKLSGTLDRCLSGGDPASKPAPPPEEEEREHARQQPVSVNTRKIAEIRSLEAQGSKDLMRRMVELYRTGSARLIQEIRDALRQGDGQALAAAAHELKSSSGSVGGERLCRLCTDVEKLGRLGRLDGVEGLLSLVEAEQRGLLGVLSKEVSSEDD
jgi:CheY-like chemotaxis protein